MLIGQPFEDILEPISSQQNSVYRSGVHLLDRFVAFER